MVKKIGTKSNPILKKCADKTLTQNQTDTKQITYMERRLVFNFSAKIPISKAKKVIKTVFHHEKIVSGGVTELTKALTVFPLNSHNTTTKSAIKQDNASEIKTFLSLRNFILKIFRLEGKKKAGRCVKYLTNR